MRFVATLAEVIALIACCLGAYQVITSIADAEASAPQQAVGVTFGFAIAIIPYCIASLFHRNAVRDQLQAPRNRPLS